MSPSKTLFFFLVLTTSCKKDDEILCDSYALQSTTEINLKETFKYNSNGLLSGISSQRDNNTYTSVLEYDDALNLKKAVYDNSTNYFYFNNDKVLEATTTYENSSGTILDSTFYEFDMDGLIIKASHGYDFIYYTQNYTYPDPRTVQVDFYIRYIVDAPFEHTGTFKYTMDDKERPYPEEYYYLWLAWGNTLLRHNEIKLDTYGSTVEPSTNTTTYNYNKGGYPLSNGYINYNYDCAE